MGHNHFHERRKELLLQTLTTPESATMQPRKRGRPANGATAEPQKRRNITMSDRLIEKARAIGDGNISEGIRIALDQAAPSMSRTKEMSTQQNQCDAFNAKYKLGTKGWLHMDNGEKKATHTTSPAQMFNGRDAVIWVKGVSGCYLLDSFEPAF